MKSTALKLFLLSSIFLLGCKEEPVLIPKTAVVSSGEHKVLVEEYTGVKCVNCPAGSAEIENLKSKYGENVIALSIHAGIFAKPYTESKYDLKVKDGEDIMAYVGAPEGYPSATIDRKQFAGQTSLQVGQNTWAGYIEQQLKEAAPLKVSLKNDYNTATRELKINVSVLPFQNINQNLRITVLMSENEISDYQSTPQGKVADYKHKHVLRDVITAATGDVLGAEYKVANLVEKSYTYKIPDTWNADKCSVIAFVHREGNDKSVLNVAELKIK
jgi:hypothetical protein